MSITEDTSGYVYCLSNPCMPGILKIGMTQDDPETRAAELSGATGVPLPFRVEISKRVARPFEKEQAMHELLSALGFRVNDKREFFNCPMGIVDRLFALIDGTDVIVGNVVATSAVVKHYAIQVVKVDETNI